MNPRAFARGAFVAAVLLATGCCIASADPPAPGAPSPPSGPAAAPPAAPPPPPLPPGVVARVRDRDLTAADIRRYLVERAKKDLSDSGSPASTVLEAFIRETAARQELARLGIVVTEADYQTRYAEIDAEVRRRSNGEQTLEHIRRGQGVSREEFRANLMHAISRERIAAHPQWLGDKLPKDEKSRIAQAEIVMGEVMKRTKVERQGLPAGIVARVGGQDLTEDAYGVALSIYLADSDRKDALREQCIRILLEQEGLTMTPEDIERAIELDRPLWLRAREDATQPEIRTLGFESFVQLRYGATIEELKTNPYRRALLALRDRVRKTVTDDDVLVAWGRGSTTEWGPVILVTDIVISFQIPRAVTEPVRRRPRDEALRLAKDYSRRLKAGENGDAIVKEIEALKERGRAAEPRRLRNFQNDVLLFDAARQLSQGQWSDVVELSSEFHLLRRDGDRPPGTFEEMKPVVREKIVSERMNAWIRERLLADVRLAPVPAD